MPSFAIYTKNFKVTNLYIYKSYLYNRNSKVTKYSSSVLAEVRIREDVVHVCSLTIFYSAHTFKTVPDQQETKDVENLYLIDFNTFILKCSL